MRGKNARGGDLNVPHDVIEGCPFRKSYPDVLVVQSSQDRNGDGTVTLTLGVELMCYRSPMHTVSYHRHRFPAEVIQHAVWLYFRFRQCQSKSA
jgi:hypothetical protein